jgi:hypothetical protein
MRYALVLCWLVLSAFTIRPTGGDFVVDYVEPTTNSDGSAITDLDHCNVYTQAGTQAIVESANIAASSPTGGGEQLPVITIYWGPVPSQALPLSFTVTCTDGTSNESVVGTPVLFAVDPYPLMVP